MFAPLNGEHCLWVREAIEEGLRCNYIYWENVYLHEILKKKPRFRVFLNVSRMFHGNFSSHRKNVRNLKVEISTISGHSFFFFFSDMNGIPISVKKYTKISPKIAILRVNIHCAPLRHPPSGETHRPVPNVLPTFNANTISDLTLPPYTKTVKRKI